MHRFHDIKNYTQLRTSLWSFNLGYEHHEQV
jgi:hypothetical protein